MTPLRTTLIAVGAGTALLATGAVVASNATATPAPVAAVEQLGVDPTPVSPAADPARDVAPGRAGARGWWTKLTDEQRTCLEGAKITRPVGPLDDAERAALRAKVEAAAAECSVTPPFAKARAFWNGLTAEQRSCLQDAALTRPWGPLTKEQRQQLRADLKAAAATCGVTVPTKATSNTH